MPSCRGRRRDLWLYAAVISLGVASIRPGVAAAADNIVPGEPDPIIRLRAGGATSDISQMVFSPDGDTLYAVGLDKVIHAWTLDDPGAGVHGFHYRPDLVRRVPIAPGPYGNLNAVAVSPDGRWLATGGVGAMEGAAGFRAREGFVREPKFLSDKQRTDLGLIYLFDTRNPAATKILRGNAGPVRGLAFAPIGGQIVLVSAASEGFADPANQTIVIRTWDIEQGREDPNIAPFPLSRQEFYGNPTASFTAWNSGGHIKVALCSGDLPKAWPARLRILDLTTRATEDPANVEALCCCTGTAAAKESLFVGRFYPQPAPAEVWKLGDGGFPSIWTSNDQFITCLQPVDEAWLAAIVQDGKHTYRRLLLCARNSPATGWRSVGISNRVVTPCVAVSARHFIAVGPAEHHEILIYPIGLQGEPGRLTAVGQVFSQVSFVHKDNQLGLQLADVGGRSIVMNLSKSLIEREEDKPNWQVAGRSSAGVAPDQQQHLENLVEPSVETLIRRDFPQGPNNAPARMTCNLLCPTPQAGPLQGIPLLAVANDRDLSQNTRVLSIYDARTGQPLCRLNGHSANVSCLACSDDGRILASCGSDYTVNLWWLPELGKTMGKRARLPAGVVMLLVDKHTMQVKEPGSTQLRRGDQIVGLFDGPAAAAYRPFESAAELSWKLANFFKPGDVVRLARQAAGGGPVDAVEIRLDSWIAELKPLCSLFFSGRPDGPWSWVAWCPHGPFEASDKSIEELVGWHFNTNKANEPAKFADIGKYRMNFFGRGLLPRLIKDGETGPWPPGPAAPTVSLFFETDKGKYKFDEDRRLYTVNDRELPFYVNVLSDQDRVEGVRVFAAGAEQPQPLARDPQFPFRWTGSLRNLIKQPGTVQLTAEVQMSIAGVSSARHFRLDDVRFETTPDERLTPRIIEVKMPETLSFVSGPIQIAVSATARQAANLTAQIEVNNRPVKANDIKIGSEQQPLSWRDVPLGPGNNVVSITLVDDNHTVVDLCRRTISVRQLPGTVKLAGQPHPIEGTATARVSVLVNSQVCPRGLKVAVNGQLPAQLVKATFSESGKDTWAAAVDVSGLSAGKNVLELRAATDDGDSQKAVTTEVVCAPPAADAPKLAIKTLRADPHDRHKFTMAFEVEPASILHQTQIVLVDARDEVPLIADETRDEGNRRTVVLHLNDGGRKIRVRSMDAQGRVAVDTQDVPVLSPPALVQIDKLVWSSGSEPLAPTVRSNVPQAKVDAICHINWDAELSAAARDHKLFAKVWVNAFLEPPQQIAPPASATAEFKVPLVLNRLKGNRLMVELSGATSDRQYYSVDCTDPDQSQELHVLVVDRKDQGARLKDEIEGAFDIVNGQSRAFANVAPPTQFGSQATSYQVWSALRQFQRYVSGPKQAHQVFLFYYRGCELPPPAESSEPAAMDGSGFLLETRDSGGIRSQDLAGFFSHVNGANLVFLDVECKGVQEGELKPWDPPALGLVRAASQIRAKTLAAYLAEAAEPRPGEQELTMHAWIERLRDKLGQDVIQSIVGKPIDQVVVRSK